MTQAREVGAEVIIPYDRHSAEVTELTDEFPGVRFIRIAGESIDESDTANARHRRYDLRRAAGIREARGEIVALTEDHVVPADDWCEQIISAHRTSGAGVIGGAIENGVDQMLNRALYYCDFGRYGRPLPPGEPSYVSDVNVSYKRDVLISNCDLYSDTYHETTVHWGLIARGVKLALNDRIVIFQHRPDIKLKKALRERVAWGRLFAETRSAASTSPQRAAYAVGTAILPAVLLLRFFRNMVRQNRRLGEMLRILPLASMLLTAWSVGEFLGYVSSMPAASQRHLEVVN